MSVLRRALARLTNGAISAQVPDGTTAGGQARGANAVDFQTQRASATNVASGATSTVGGGHSNTASNQHSTVSGGVGGTASGFGSAVGGGNANTANGTYAWVPGGQTAHTRGQFGRGAWSSGNFAATGDAQAGEAVLRRATADATATVLTSDGGAPGATNQYAIPFPAAAAFRLLIVARQVGGNECAMWEFGGLLRRHDAASITASATPAAGAAQAPAHGTAGTTGWTVTLGTDPTTGALTVTVTGAAATNIRWVARIMAAEVAG